MFGSGTDETPAERFRRRSADLIDTARRPRRSLGRPVAVRRLDRARRGPPRGGRAGPVRRVHRPRAGGRPVGGRRSGGRLEASLGQTQANLDDEAVARTGYDGHFGPTTYESSVDRFASADLVVHRWDLGTGAGVEVVLDDRDVAASLEDLDALEEPMRSMMRGPGARRPRDRGRRRRRRPDPPARLPRAPQRVIREAAAGRASP
ncbi:MAG: hypothetical protein R2711_11690 [Acidimicrobiales bacterium]